MKTRIIDLSIPCSSQSEGFTITRRGKPPVYLGHECYAYDLVIESHRGTYFETSAHVFREGRNTDQVPLEDLVLSGVCVRIEKSEQCICAGDLKSACGTLNPGCALLVDAGQGSDRYFSRDAAQWMAQNRVKLMGSSIPLYDRGFTNPTGFFIDLFKAEIPIIANLANLSKLPERGFTVIVLPLGITGICTVPCRVIAVEKENTKE